MYLHGWQCSGIKLYVPHRRLTLNFIIRMDSASPHRVPQARDAKACSTRRHIQMGSFNYHLLIYKIFRQNNQNTARKCRISRECGSRGYFPNIRTLLRACWKSIFHANFCSRPRQPKSNFCPAAEVCHLSMRHRGVAYDK